MRNKKIKKIFTILLFIFITITSIIIGFTNPKYSELSFVSKMVSPVFSEFTLLLFDIFGANNIYIILLSLSIVLLILPSMPKIFVGTVKLFARTKEFILILLSGNSPLPEDEKWNLEMEEKYDRNYKKFIEYIKLKEIPIHYFLIFPLYSFYLSLVTYGCISLPISLLDIDYSFLWITDVRCFDLITMILFLTFVIYILVKKIQQKKVLPLVISIIAYSTTFIVGIDYCFTYLVVLCLFLTFKLKGGKKKNAKKN